MEIRRIILTTAIFVTLVLVHCFDDVWDLAPKIASPKRQKQRGNHHKGNLKRSCNQRRICMNVLNCPRYKRMYDESEIFGSAFAIDQRKVCGMVNKRTPKVCCPSQARQQPSVSWTKVGPKEKPKSVLSEITDYGKKEGVADHPNFQLLPLDICGPLPTAKRITGGTDSHEFPWMANIRLFRNVTDSEYHCGGTLISTRYILTAAHCLIDDITVHTVTLGQYNTSSTKEKVQIHKVDKTILHSLFDPLTLQNDIALLRLTESVQFVENIKPICLPVNMDGQLLEGKMATVVGWGVTDYSRFSDVLQEVQVPVFTLNECHDMFDFGGDVRLFSTQICAGGFDGKDSCGGDSGGPLKYITNLNGSPAYVQYGIVSYGSKVCGLQSIPGIYTKVQSYLEWILDNMY